MKLFKLLKKFIKKLIEKIKIYFIIKKLKKDFNNNNFIY
jgi:hypothetical protein